MKKFSVLLIIFVFVNHLSGQVTIGSSIEPPTGTLLNLQQFIPTDNNATAKGGFLLPRVDILNQTDLSSINPSATSSDKSNLTGLTLYNIGSGISSGLKIWDGSSWKGLLSDYIAPVSNGISISNDKVVLGGILDTPTTITSTTAGNNLEFTSTADSSNLLITGNAKVGIGTNSPVNTFHLNGTFAFVKGSDIYSQNNPRILDESYRTMMVSETDGNVIYAPKGSTIMGGFRPSSSSVGKDLLITTVDPTNTILTVSFECFVNQSSDDVNSYAGSYTYGDFTIIGRSATSPAYIVENNIKGYDGNAKTLSINTNTTIQWLDKDNKPFTIKIDQSTGNLTINSGILTHSFVFVLLGNIQPD